MIAYLIGGPCDLTKMVVEDHTDRVSMPSLKTTNFFPTGEVRPYPEVKTHKYRKLAHELDDVFYLFYYEGTW